MTQTIAKTARIEVFDPAMCCSTGVCGTDVDQNLVTFAADAAWAVYFLAGGKPRQAVPTKLLRQYAIERAAPGASHSHAGASRARSCHPRLAPRLRR